MPKLTLHKHTCKNVLMDEKSIPDLRSFLHPVSVLSTWADGILCELAGILADGSVLSLITFLGGKI